MDLETIKEIVEATWFVPVITLLGAIIGGIFTLFGSILGIYLQSRITSKSNKRNILLEYYRNLASLKKEIVQINNNTINMDIIKNMISNFKNEFELNGTLSYYIGKKFLKKWHKQFIKDLETLVENRDLKMFEIKQQAIKLIDLEKNLAMKKM